MKTQKRKKALVGWATPQWRDEFINIYPENAVIFMPTISTIKFPSERYIRKVRITIEEII